jgi:hypothetical protein
MLRLFVSLFLAVLAVDSSALVVELPPTGSTRSVSYVLRQFGGNTEVSTLTLSQAVPFDLSEPHLLTEFTIYVASGNEGEDASGVLASSAGFFPVVATSNELTPLTFHPNVVIVGPFIHMLFVADPVEGPEPIVTNVLSIGTAGIPLELADISPMIISSPGCVCVSKV